jgi:hypothetical protein
MEVRRQNILVGFSCGSGFPRPPRLKAKPMAGRQPRTNNFNDFNGGAEKNKIAGGRRQQTGP